MSIFCRLLRKHYWGTPHRASDDKLVQVCYECGAERPASDLYNEVSLWNSFEPRRVETGTVADRQFSAEPLVAVAIEYKGNLSLVK